jgi:hypothetical protein
VLQRRRRGRAPRDGFDAAVGEVREGSVEVDGVSAFLLSGHDIGFSRKRRACE